MAFVATLTYELDPSTTPEARKMVRAELCGRRWQDRWEGRLMPAGCLWIRRTTEPGETVDDLMRHCERDLNDAAAAVEATGRSAHVRRAWVQVSGAGTWGLLATPARSE
jgi:hypothetical protein